MPSPLNYSTTQIAIAWCIAWGTNLAPQHSLEKFKSWRKDLTEGRLPNDPEWQQAFSQAQILTEIFSKNAKPNLTEISDLIAQHPTLWNSSVGLLYGGVTRVKSYVFESADLQEIRGASALLDRINLVDLPALFHAEDSAHLSNGEQFNLCQQAPTYCDNVRKETFNRVEENGSSATNSFITDALIPELIVYATGGKILAFCPAAYHSQICNAIEKRYTSQTLTANSCAVGAAFRPIEIYAGLLKDPIKTTLWHNAIASQYRNNAALQSYFSFRQSDSDKAIKTAFENRKNFSELVGKLSAQFNQRRSGDDATAQVDEGWEIRPSRRYPPMFETHPYLLRDDNDVRSMVTQISADKLPDAPKLSEPTARKRRVGQITKRDEAGGNWYKKCGFEALWNPNPVKGEPIFQSWVSRFEAYLKETDAIAFYDEARNLFKEQGGAKEPKKREARSLHEIGAGSNGYVAYIYADGNSMGQYIRDKIKTPAAYQQFSIDVFEATEQSVYKAIATHIRPYHYKPDAKSSREDKSPVWIHPFEIVTIGGDDVLLIVPANNALEVAHSIGKYFEDILVSKGRYALSEREKFDGGKNYAIAHRYKPALAPKSECCLSTSSGVLITAADTPIYYADKLVSQLLKSAKQQLKKLKKEHSYHSGTVDFLVLKAVTMVSSNIAAFRQEGLTILPPPPDPHRSPDLPAQRTYTLKLYAAPYTLHELDGLIETVRAIKSSGFPKSQLYQIRSLLERGKRTAILNYRYFRARLAKEKRMFLEEQFEQGWCNASTNNGNLAPWLTTKTSKDEKDNQSAKKKQPKKDSTVYETIWREMVELEPFIQVEEASSQSPQRSEALPTSQTQSASPNASKGKTL